MNTKKTVAVIALGLLFLANPMLTVFLRSFLIAFVLVNLGSRFFDKSAEQPAFFRA